MTGTGFDSGAAGRASWMGGAGGLGFASGFAG
jgi:hypothetical protein